MKKHACYNLSFLVFGVLFWLGATTYADSAYATNQDSTVTDAELNVSGELQIGQPVTFRFDLKGYEISNGSYSSINVRFVTKPEGSEPKVKTGYPRTTLLFHTAGTYRIIFILNEVSKPSCGGVDAKKLLEKTIELQITE